MANKKVFTDESLATLVSETKTYVDSAVSTKANSNHTHDDRYYTESEVNNLLSKKADSSHGTHVSYSTTAPVMDGTASAGSASTVARSDHKHPTDTSRASQIDLDALEAVVAGKSDAHSHPYAGSSSQGGAANSANKLNTNAGSATQPVYFANGVPVATTYTLGKSVPSDAKFTDTTYSVATTSANGLLASTDKKKIDAISGTYSMGDFSSKTVADLQAALDTWLNSYCAIANASATFTASADWITGWNSGNTSATISAGGRWVVTNIAIYDNKLYTQLRFACYSDGQVVYVVRSNGNWRSVRWTAFRDDLKAHTDNTAIHVSYGTSTPLVAGTGAVGTSSGLARIDHVHPAQTNVSGNAGTVTGTKTNPTSGTSYCIPFHSGYTTGNKSMLTNDGIGYWTNEGTTSALGTGELKLGNNIASGTAGNKRGMIYMYGTSTGYTEIIPANNTTSNIQIYLPSTGGTLALTTSNVDSATKATQDASGNTITSTYETKSDASAKLTEAKTYADSAASKRASSSHTHTVSHTPAGSVSSSFTGEAVTSGASSGTTSVYSITGVGSTPSLSASVTNRCLTLTFNAGSVPTRSSVTLPSTSHTHSVTAKGSVSSSFTGTAATLTSGAPK